MTSSSPARPSWISAAADAAAAMAPAAVPGGNPGCGDLENPRLSAWQCRCSPCNSGMDAMVNGLGIGASAMNAQSEPLSVLANNRANSAAAGFKAEHLSFLQLLTSPPA